MKKNIIAKLTALKPFALRGMFVLALGVFIGVGVVTALTSYTWHDPSTWIQDGAVISATNLRDNLNYLYTHSLPNCGDGETVVSNAGVWGCGNVSTTTPGSPYLVYNQHTELQCTSLGGAVVTDSLGKTFCRFASGSCTIGWTPYKKWGTYVSNTCPSSSYNAYNPPCYGYYIKHCTTSALPWSNPADVTLLNCTYNLEEHYQRARSSSGYNTACRVAGPSICTVKKSERGCF